jgi:uroporphyrinogen-III synthase
MSSPRVFSTRILQDESAHLIHRAGWELHHSNLIQTESLPNLKEHPKWESSPSVCISSMASLRALAKNHLDLDWSRKLVCAVGEKLRLALKSRARHFQCVDYAKEISELEDVFSEPFLVIRGEKGLSTITDYLQKNGHAFNEWIVYKTIFLTSNLPDPSGSKVLFFSPSALESFKMSHPETSIEEAICIGETTAKKAQEYGMKTSISYERSERAVVLKLLDEGN